MILTIITFDPDGTIKTATATEVSGILSLETGLAINDHLGRWCRDAYGYRLFISVIEFGSSPMTFAVEFNLQKLYGLIPVTRAPDYEFVLEGFLKMAHEREHAAEKAVLRKHRSGTFRRSPAFNHAPAPDKSWQTVE